MSMKRIGEYVVLTNHILGKGGFSVVYIGVNTRTKENVAVKVVDKRQIRYSKALNYVEDEIKYLQEIDHENILKCKSVFREDQKIFIILELCVMDFYIYMSKRRSSNPFRGRSTHKRELEPFLPEIEIRYWMTHLRNGLKVLFDKQLIHRDLKPENLLMIRKNQPIESERKEQKYHYSMFNLKISDLGFSKRVPQGDLTQSSCGTLSYFSPEQISFQYYDYKIDLWAIGMICLEMIQGRRMFSISRKQSKKARVQKMRSLLKTMDVKSILKGYSVSRHLKELVYGLLTNNTTRFTFEEFYKHSFFTFVPFVNQSKQQEEKKEMEENEEDDGIEFVDCIENDDCNKRNMEPEIISLSSSYSFPPSTQEISNPIPSAKGKAREHPESSEDSSVEFLGDGKNRPKSGGKFDNERKLLTSTIYAAQRIELMNTGVVMYQRKEKLLYKCTEKTFKVPVFEPGEYELQISNLDLSFLGVLNKFYAKVLTENVEIQCCLIDMAKYRCRKSDPTYTMVEEIPLCVRVRVPLEDISQNYRLNLKEVQIIVKLRPKKQNFVVQYIKKKFISFSLVLRKCKDGEYSP